jgi:hypothetical protein
MNETIQHAPETAPRENATTDASAQPEPRPWVKPTFERVDMKEALTATNDPAHLLDGPGITSS